MDGLDKSIPLAEGMDEGDFEELKEDLKEAGLDSIYAGIPDSVLLDSLKNNQLWERFVDKGKKGQFTLSSADYPSVAAYDSAQLAKPEEDRDSWLKRRLAVRSIELNQKYENNTEGFARDFGQSFMDNFSKVLFFLLPFFALLLK